MDKAMGKWIKWKQQKKKKNYQAKQLFHLGFGFINLWIWLAFIQLIIQWMNELY